MALHLPNATDLIAKADCLACAAHAGQVDKLGVPYIEHVRAVAQSVAHLGAEHVIVGLLHDSLEDCDDTTIVSRTILEAQFGPKVANAVDALTKRDGQEYATQYIAGVRADPLACTVKRADLAHNMGRLHLLPPDQRARLQEKYASALLALD